MNQSTQLIPWGRLGALVLLLCIAAAPAQARLSEPDHVLYGTATWFGELLAPGTLITLRLDGAAEPVASYTLGQEEQLGGLYALRIPMDSIDPRLPGRARPGEGASVFINESIVANVLVGEYGEAQRLDIDPAFLGGDTSAIVIASAQALEGNSGTSSLVFDVNLTTPSADPVSFDWATTNGTATGAVGSCSGSADFVHDNTIGGFAAGETATTISITLCGDTVVEENETLTVTLSNPQNAILQFQSATGTIINDDGQPGIIAADLVVAEPASGQITASFDVLLTRAFTQTVEVDFETVADTATASVDYIGTSGRLTIPAGATSAQVDFQVLSDNLVEVPEALTLQLSNPANATLSDAEGLGIILDADTQPRNQLADVARNGANGVEGLAGPSDVVFSPDDRFVYVTTLISRTVVTFSLDNLGRLGFLGKIDAATSGFAAGLFDGLQALVMSNDGNYIYVAASGNNGIMVLSRNPTDGSLALAGTIANGDDSGGTPVTGLNGVWDLALSGDGAHLYAVGATDDAVAVFSIDSGTGLLTLLEVETNGVDDPGDAGPQVGFMDRPVSIRLSPDGSRVMVGSDFSSSFGLFSRVTDAGQADYGRLSFVDVFRNNVSGISGIGSTSDLAISPDGQHTYVLGRTDDTIARFAMAGASAQFIGRLDRQTDRFAGLDGPDSVNIKASGDELYAVGFDDSSFVLFDRNNDSASAQYGTLQFVEIYLDDTGGISTLGGPTAVVSSNNEGFVIVAAGLDNAVNVFAGGDLGSVFADSFEDP